MPKPRRVTFKLDEHSLASHEQLEAQGRSSLLWRPPQAPDDEAFSPKCTIMALAALGYATLAAQLAGHTPLPFAELPARVQAGWLAAARAMRQQVLEEADDAPAS